MKVQINKIKGQNLILKVWIFFLKYNFTNKKYEWKYIKNSNPTWFNIFYVFKVILKNQQKILIITVLKRIHVFSTWNFQLDNWQKCYLGDRLVWPL